MRNIGEKLCFFTTKWTCKQTEREIKFANFSVNKVPFSQKNYRIQCKTNIKTSFCHYIDKFASNLLYFEPFSSLKSHTLLMANRDSFRKLRHTPDYAILFIKVYTSIWNTNSFVPRPRDWTGHTMQRSLKSITETVFIYVKVLSRNSRGALLEHCAKFPMRDSILMIWSQWYDNSTTRHDTIKLCFAFCFMLDK